jgi:hypothetical protein
MNELKYIHERRDLGVNFWSLIHSKLYCRVCVHWKMNMVDERTESTEVQSR